MPRELRQERWREVATERAADGMLDTMVSNELFDHTWAASLHQLNRHLRFAPDHTVLDAGCGWGRLLLGVKYFHPAVFVEGYELAPEFVDKARALVASYGLSEGVKIVQADLVTTDLPQDHYDSIYSSRVLHYIEEKEVVIRRFHLALKVGGRAMIIIPNRNCLYQWFAYKHAPLYPIRSIGRMMKAVGFTNIQYGGYRFLPSNIHSSHQSAAARLEKAFGSTAIGRIGGLAYVVGDK